MATGPLWFLYLPRHVRALPYVEPAGAIAPRGAWTLRGGSVDKGECGLDPVRGLVLVKFVNNDAANIDAEATQYCDH